MKTQSSSGVASSDRFGGREAGDLAKKGIEAALCAEITRFEQQYMGRRPHRVHAHLLGDLLLVRLQGVLTAAERELAQASPSENGLILLKQMRETLVEANRSIIEAMVERVAGAQVRSLHHDISTVTGEEVLVFTLVETPDLT